MAMEDFAREILVESKALDKTERVARTKKLALVPSTKKFIEKYLPELYVEAFPPSDSGAGQVSESRPPQTLCAKPS
jgi:hypothetical protein